MKKMEENSTNHQDDNPQPRDKEKSENGVVTIDDLGKFIAYGCGFGDSSVA